MKDLKPCPFCGSKGHVEQYIKDGTEMWYVQCLKCYASTWYAGTIAEAQAEWERRDSLVNRVLRRLCKLM